MKVTPTANKDSAEDGRSSRTKNSAPTADEGSAEGSREGQAVLSQSTSDKDRVDSKGRQEGCKCSANS